MTSDQKKMFIYKHSEFYRQKSFRREWKKWYVKKEEKNEEDNDCCR